MKLSVDRKTFFKNSARSTKYLVEDVLKKRYPTTYAAINLKNTMSKVNQEVRQAEVEAERIKRNSRKERPELKGNWVENLIEDISSGNFYNKRRIDSMNKDFEDANGSFEKDFASSLDSFGSSVNNITVSMNKQNELSKRISEREVESRHFDFLMGDSMSRKRHSESMELTNVISENIINLVQFNNDKFSPFMDQSLKFYQDTMDQQRTMNESLKGILEIQQAMKNATSPSADNKDVTKMQKLFSGGSFNLEEYYRNVRTKYGEYGALGILFGLAGLGDGKLNVETGPDVLAPGFLDNFTASPISKILSFMSLPGNLNKRMEAIEGGFNSLPASLLLSMKDIEKNENLDKIIKKIGGTKFGKFFDLDKQVNQARTKANAANILKDILGMNSNTEYKLEKFERGPMAFNGITQKAITSVIPNLLAKIYQAVSHEEEQYVVDYNRGGKLVKASQKRQEFDTIYNNAATSSLSKFNEEMTSMIGMANIDSEQQGKIYDDLGKINRYLAEGNLLKVNDPKFQEQIKKISPEYNEFFMSLFKNLPIEVMNRLPYEQLVGRNALAAISRQLEIDADNNGLSMLDAESEVKSGKIMVKDINREKMINKVAPKNKIETKDDLTAENIGGILGDRLKSLRRMKADKNGETPQLEETEKTKSILSTITTAPITAADYTLGKLAKMLNRLIYGTDEEGKGLIEGLYDKFSGFKQKLKDWGSQLLDTAREKWNESEIGQYVNGKYDAVKQWINGENEEGFGAGFKSSVKSVFDSFKQSAKDTYTSVTGREDATFKGTIEYMKEKLGYLKTYLFGNDERDGVFHREYIQGFKDLGFDTKQTGKVLGSAAVGAIGSLFLPGGPLLWGLVGGGASFVNASEKLKETLFGTEEAEGLVPKELVEAFPDIKKGAGIGLISSIVLRNFLPGGPFTGMLVGSMFGYMKKTEAFSKLFYGKDKDGNKIKDGLIDKIKNTLYDTIGGKIHKFFDKQMAKFSHTFDKYLFVPIKNAIQPVAKAFIKASTNLVTGLAKMLDKSTGGILSKIMKGLGKGLLGGITNMTLGLHNAISFGMRSNIKAVGTGINMMSTLLAKYGMTPEEYEKWKQGRKNDRDAADRRLDEKMRVINGKTYKHGDFAVVDQLDETKDAVISTIDENNEIVVEKLEENKENVKNVVETATEKIVGAIKEPESNSISNDVSENDNIIPADYKSGDESINTDSVVDKLTSTLKEAVDVVNGKNVVEDSEKEPSVTENVAEKIVIKVTDIDKKPFGFDNDTPSDYNGEKDSLIGEDVLEQKAEMEDKKRDKVLENIEINTRKTADNIEDIEHDGDGKTSFWDAIKNIGSGIFGILGSVGKFVVFGGAIYEILRKFGEGKTLPEAAGEVAAEHLPTTGGVKLIKKGVNTVDNVYTGVKNTGRVGKKVVNSIGKNTAKIASRITGKEVFKEIASGNKTVTSVVKDSVKSGAKNIAGKAVDGAKGITNKIGKGISGITSKVTGGKIGKELASGNKTVTSVVNDGVKGAKNVASLLVKQIDDVFKALCNNKNIGKYMQPLYNAAKRIFPEIAEKAVKAASKAGAKTLFKSARKLLGPAELAFYVNDGVTGFFDYKNILHIPNDSEFDLIMACVCAGAKVINGLACGFLPIRLVAEVLLTVFGKKGKLQEMQDEFNRNAAEAGFGDNIETYNRVENPTFWQKIGSAVGLADTRKEVIKKEIDNLKKELSELDVNSEEYKALQDRLNLLVNEYEDVSNKWYESFGNFVEMAVVNPVKGVFGFMTGSWLKPLKDWMFGEKGKEEENDKEEEKKDQGGPRVTQKASKDITQIPDPENNNTTGMGGESDRHMPIHDDYDNAKNISSGFGNRTFRGKAQFHPGVDYAAPKGTPIYSAADGVAYVAKYGDNGGWGNYVRVRHNDGYETVYGHASKLNIEEGTTVKAGQKIAEVGTTGNSTGNHLHFGVYKTPESGAQPKYLEGYVDPLSWLEGAKASDGSVTPASETSTNGTSQNSDKKNTDAIVDDSVAKEYSSDLTGILSAVKDWFSSLLMGTDFKGTPAKEDAAATQPTIDLGDRSVTTASANDFLGKASVKYETGVENGDPSFVSKGDQWGDPGGISYGIPQFATNTGSAQTFVNKIMGDYPVYKRYFQGKKPGTDSFGTAWKQAARERGDEFMALQLDSIYDDFYSPWVKKMKNLYGVDMNKDRALQEAAYSISVQHGMNSAKKYGEGVKNSMTTEQALDRLYQNRHNKAGYPTTTRWNKEINDVKAYAGKKPIGYTDKDFLNKFLKSDAAKGGPREGDISVTNLPNLFKNEFAVEKEQNEKAMGGPRVDNKEMTENINETLNKYYSDMSDQIQTTVNNSKIAETTDALNLNPDIVKFLKEIAKNTADTAVAVTKAPGAIAEVISEAVGNVTVNNNTTVRASSGGNSNAANVFLSQVDKARNTATDMMRKRALNIAKGN